VIDATEAGDVPWQAFAITYDGEVPDNPPIGCPHHMKCSTVTLLLVMESQIGNHNFRNRWIMHEASIQPNGHGSSVILCWGLGMGASDIIVKDSEAHGAMFAPMILGSDKTTVSVTTGHKNTTHSTLELGMPKSCSASAPNALAVVGFLAIPKS
ncbi:hypothetical protein BJV74DRAFT_753248, partial [Russula compacta]